MSLLTENMESCTLMYQIRTDDGRGGYDKQWVEGATFDAAIAFNASIQSRMAEAVGAKSLYDILIPKDFMLEYHNIFKRNRDGKYFRVTSDGDDLFTPQSATLNLRKVNAEEFVPTGV